MPGVGKTTIGALLAEKLGRAFIDTDYLIEALYAMRLQDVSETLARDQFLDAECEAVLSIRPASCVIATGGSVIYRPKAMAHLRRLGSVAHLRSPLETVRERVNLNPERGICSAPGQNFDDLYRERMALYGDWAEKEYDTALLRPDECADLIISDFDLKKPDFYKKIIS